MSEIDRYKHRLLGVIHCPADFEIVAYNDSHRDIPIYELLEDPLEASFEGKRGDVLVGGGSGETEAFRISMPETIRWCTSSEFGDFPLSQFVKPYWNLTQAYNFGTGYRKVGWDPKTDQIEFWLTEHVIAFLVKNYPGYRALNGPDALNRDGSICRMPTKDDVEAWG